MTDNFINDKKTRDEIVKYIRILLKDVNERIILKYFNNLKSSDISTKSADDDFVSIADKKSEELIFNKLIGFLDIKNFIGEESSYLNKKQYINLLNEQLVWVVDPIDGTKNYINGKDNFCSMISLVCSSIPVATFIYHPLKNNFVYGFRDFGAYSMNTDTKKIIRLSIDTSNSITILGSGGTKGIPDRYRQSILYNLRTKTKRVFIGSAGIETIMLAKNQTQFLFHGRVTPWDHSPLDLIVREAGGVVYMVKNKEKFNLNSNGPILAASNHEIWDQIKEIAIPKNHPYLNNIY
ncbi:inositol monophosphatase [Alphaproteobacteria bacterium]|nr:inositol monophosphatase [Alphaproteobacteria bacterium]